jgi:hypothetical protein
MMFTRLSPIFLSVLLLTLSSCVHRAAVKAPTNIIRKERFSYVKDDDGRFYIVTTTPKDLDEAMKSIRPGPASVDKLDLWVVTPLGPAREVKH